MNILYVPISEISAFCTQDNLINPLLDLIKFLKNHLLVSFVSAKHISHSLIYLTSLEIILIPFLPLAIKIQQFTLKKL